MVGLFIALVVGGVVVEWFYWTGLVLAPISADLALSDIFRLDHFEGMLFHEYPQDLVYMVIIDMKRDHNGDNNMTTMTAWQLCGDRLASDKTMAVVQILC